MTAIAQRLHAPTNHDLPVLLLTAGMLLVLGLVLIASASMGVAADDYGNPFYFLVRQLLYSVLGCLAGIAVANVPLVWWFRGAWVWLFAAFALLVVVLTPLGITVNGSTRWIPLGVVNLQVSEVAKWLLVAYLASYTVRRREELVATWQGFLKPIALLFLAAALLLAQPDFGAVVVLMAAALGMMFLAGVGLARFAPLIAACAALGGLLILVQPYRLDRVVTYLDPWKNQFDSGYQLTQSLIAFGRGQWTGEGLGNSVQKLSYLPEAHTDFIFAIAAEEFGLLGALLILLGFTVLVWLGLRIAFRAKAAGMEFGASIAYGLTLLIALQAFINMAVNTGLLPTKGLTLPLVSYGGSSLLVTCISLGVIARVEMERQDQMGQGGKRHGS